MLHLVKLLTTTRYLTKFWYGSNGNPVIGFDIKATTGRSRAPQESIYWLHVWFKLKIDDYHTLNEVTLEIYLKYCIVL